MPKALHQNSINKIRQMKKDKYTLKEIAKECNVSEMSVKKYSKDIPHIYYTRLNISKWRANCGVIRILGPYIRNPEHTKFVLIYYKNGKITKLNYCKYLLEEKLQRELKNNEKIIYKDGNIRNYDINNLELGIISYNIKISEFRKSIMPDLIQIQGPYISSNGRESLIFYFKKNKNRGFEHSRFKYEEHYKIQIPEGMEVDHIDGNSLNNDISNLQLLTPYENQLKSKGLAEYVVSTCPFTEYKKLIPKSKIKDDTFNNRFKRICNPNLTLKEYRRLKSRYNFTNEKWRKYIKDFPIYVIDKYRIYQEGKTIKELDLNNLNKINPIMKFDIPELYHNGFITIEELGYKYLYTIVPPTFKNFKLITIFKDRKNTDLYYLSAHIDQDLEYQFISDKNNYSYKYYDSIVHDLELSERQVSELKVFYKYIDLIIEMAKNDKVYKYIT